MWNDYAGVLLDVDGVLILGGEAIPGAAGAVRRFLDAGTAVAFATNNATRTPEQVAELLTAVGVPAEPENVVTSSMAAARTLAPGTRCLVIGMEGLYAALDDAGCAVVADPQDADAVVVGLDRDLVWDDLRRATLALRNGARFVATNTDRTFPGPDGLEPGAGALVAALEAASGRPPDVVAGKPHPPLFHAAADLLPPGRLLMVGDRLDTDIDGAAALGWDTALVLTGVSSRQEAEAHNPPVTIVAASLAALAEGTSSHPA